MNAIAAIGSRESALVSSEILDFSHCKELQNTL